MPAYTNGTVSYFASSDVGLHVAVHEAAHQLQHRGEARDAGLGPEGHANAVADAVVAGTAPRPLLNGGGAVVPSAERGYVDADRKGDVFGAPGTKDARLSEDGTTLTWYAQEAYATDGMIETANAILRAKDSGISLTRSGKVLADVPAPPNGETVNDLHSIEVTFANGPYDDCGRMAREIMGSRGADTTAYAIAAPGGIRGRTPKLADVAQKSPLGHVALVLDMDAAMAETEGSREDKKKAGDEVREQFDSVDTDKEIRDLVEKRSAGLTRKRRKQMGIDEFAKPMIGESYAIAPGVPEAGRFPYHWAAVIFVAGSDRVVLEASGSASAASDDYDAASTDWKIQTYGTKKLKQTFHHAWQGKLGQHEHTLRMATSPEPPADIATFHTTPAADLFTRLDENRPAADHFYVARELQRRSVFVELTVVQASDSSGTDAIALVFPRPPLGRTTSTQEVATGNSKTFVMPISDVWPLPRSMEIAVWVEALLGSNKAFSFAWDWPFPEATTAGPGDSPQYDIKIYIA